MDNCRGCGAEVETSSRYCAYCGCGLAGVVTPAATISRRFCVSCGRTIGFADMFCQYCGHDFRPPTPAMRTGLDDTSKVLLYLLSVFLPIAGIVVGVVFMTRDQPDYKVVGRDCLAISLVVLVLTLPFLWILLLA